MAQPEPESTPAPKRSPVSSWRAESDGSPVLWMQGDHDASTTEELSATIQQALETHTSDLVVDLSGVTFLDAATVGVLCRAIDPLAEQGRSLILRSPSERARRVLKLCGVTAEPTDGLADRLGTRATNSALSTWVAVPQRRATNQASSTDPESDTNDRPNSVRSGLGGSE